ncbi:hypothetical protein BDW75DRAFT_227751 [Aspergillus navahoensis]
MSNSTPLPSVKTKAIPGPAPNGLGRGLFAYVDIRTCDDILHIHDPFVAVLKTERLGDTCSGCFGKRHIDSYSGNGVVLKACTGCHVVKYCDRTCQSKDWKLVHSRECAIFMNLKPKVLPINARALLRMVLRTGAKKNAYTQEELGLFQTLETHIDDILEKNAPQAERIALTSRAVKEYSKTDMEDDMIVAYHAKLDLNSFNLTIDDDIGIYLHPYAALINHSCDYNAVVGFDGSEFFVKAIRPIAKGEQIFISYVDTTYPTRTRQKELRERYFFTCKCAKCSCGEDPEPTGEAGAAAKEAYAFLEESRSSSSFIDEQKLVTVTKSLLSHNLPKTKQPFVSILDEKIASDIFTGKFDQAFFNSALRVSRIDPHVYLYKAHPLRASHALTLAKLAFYSYQSSCQLSDSEKNRLGVEGPQKASQLNFGLLAWALLGDLVAKEEEYCTVPGFKERVRNVFAEVEKWLMSEGRDPRRMGKEIKRERRKLELLVDMLHMLPVR